MTRASARELLMQMLYQMEIQDDYSSDAKDSFIEMNIDEDDQLDYINNVYSAFIDNKDKIDKLIESNSKGWKINRLSKVDLAVLRLCICEFKFLDEKKATPVGAAINEAVRICKKYGSDDSGKFVNGILGQISRL